MTRPQNPQTCLRPNCNRTEENHGYCRKHMRHHAAVGYVDAAIVYRHLDALRERGYTLKTLGELAGCCPTTLVKRNNKRFQAALAGKILAIPIPKWWFREEPTALVSAVGTARRIQALQFSGYTLTFIGSTIGMTRQRLQQCTTQQFVTVGTAAAVDKVFRELVMTPGPSEKARRAARRLGFVSGLSWDDIDDPHETPVVEHRFASFLDRYQDAVSVGIPLLELPKRLGMKPESLATSMRRHNLTVPKALYELVDRRTA